jgi:APA family basic amino acid/polyamine antiporter
VVGVGVVIGMLALIGNVRTTWSFSAFTVLVYYALTNLAALRLPAEQRLFPRWVAGCGMASCLGLAFWVEPKIWISGLALMGSGQIWHLVARRSAGQT